MDSEWYFGTFEDLHFEECKSREELKEFEGNVRKLIKEKNRVRDKKSLESVILKKLNST